jgi:VanZ family protein
MYYYYMNIINRNNKKEDENENIMNGILLLVLAISGNFIAETMGCQLRKELSENMYAKHAVILFIIFFSLGFASNDNINPLILFRDSLIIWVLFVLFTKMSLRFNSLVFIFIAVYHVIYTYIKYYKSKYPEKYKDRIKTLNNILNYILYLLIIIIIVGFILYFNKQYQEYKKNWSTSKFLFGSLKCKSTN